MCPTSLAQLGEVPLENSGEGVLKLDDQCAVELVGDLAGGFAVALLTKPHSGEYPVAEIGRNLVLLAAYVNVEVNGLTGGSLGEELTDLKVFKKFSTSRTVCFGRTSGPLSRATLRKLVPFGERYFWTHDLPDGTG